MTTTKTAIKITDVRTVGIPVTDQDRAVAFYVDTLGFEKRLDAPFGNGDRWIEVAPHDASTSVALVATHDEHATGVDTGIRFTTADAASDHAELRARNVDTDEEILHFEGVPPMFAFRDPDGNRLVIVERM